jgi:hypothetical protein
MISRVTGSYEKLSEPRPRPVNRRVVGSSPTRGESETL